MECLSFPGHGSGAGIPNPAQDFTLCPSCASALGTLGKLRGVSCPQTVPEVTSPKRWNLVVLREPLSPSQHSQPFPALLDNRLNSFPPPLPWAIHEEPFSRGKSLPKSQIPPKTRGNFCGPSGCLAGGKRTMEGSDTDLCFPPKLRDGLQ